MSVDEQIREHLMRANADLPEPGTETALGAVLERAGSARRRWAVLTGAAASATLIASVLVGSVLLDPDGGPDEQLPDAPAVPAAPDEQLSETPAAPATSDEQLTEVDDDRLTRPPPGHHPARGRAAPRPLRDTRHREDLPLGGRGRLSGRRVRHPACARHLRRDGGPGRASLSGT
ncbi:hypothetical protein [Ornithinimicrobium sp. W1665]|uniref:hypothetical protein n=1 Tax=Ornithinimicrobium sp. W1665 TaxID=3416666 RepID=UPI003D6A378D